MLVDSQKYKTEGPEVTIGTREATVEVPTDVDIDVKTDE